MIGKKRLLPWSAIIVVLGFLTGTGYYFLNRPPVINAGEEGTLSKEAALEIQEGKEIRNRQNAAKIFRDILKTPPETLTITATLKGDSDSALRAAKLWELTEPGNQIAQSLQEALKRTRTCGTERCSVRLTNYKANQDFRSWLAALKTKYPDNPNVALMTVEDSDDPKPFTDAIKNPHASLDFNFSVELCAPWVGSDTTARLRKDWNNNRTVPAALRLTQRLTCCNDDFCATQKDGEEALHILEEVVKTAPATDIESIREGWLWAKARTTE